MLCCSFIWCVFNISCLIEVRITCLSVFFQRTFTKRCTKYISRSSEQLYLQRLFFIQHICNVSWKWWTNSIWNKTQTIVMIIVEYSKRNWLCVSALPCVWKCIFDYFQKNRKYSVHMRENNTNVDRFDMRSRKEWEQIANVRTIFVISFRFLHVFSWVFTTQSVFTIIS